MNLTHIHTLKNQMNYAARCLIYMLISGNVIVKVTGERYRKLSKICHMISILICEILVLGAITFLNILLIILENM
jgi:hypothetical protein